MNNDIETAKEKRDEIQKLQEELHEQSKKNIENETRLAKDIEKIWGRLERNLCNELRRSGLELNDLLGNKYYQ